MVIKYRKGKQKLSGMLVSEGLEKRGELSLAIQTERLFSLCLPRRDLMFQIQLNR